MRKIRLVELCLFAGLAVSLGIKVAPVGAAIRDQVSWDVQTAAAFEKRGFSIKGIVPDRDPPMLSVHKPGCDMQIAEVSPLGWHRDLLANIVRPDEHLLFVYQGAVFETQPVWRTSTGYHWNRLRSYVGCSDEDGFVLGIIASENCRAAEMEW
jgi:hypothetical protein